MSTNIQPIQQPVTGKEEIRDLSLPEQALAQFYKAINSGDLSVLEQNWNNSPEAAMDNPLGGIRRGWPEIRQVYERLFATRASYAFEFWDYTQHHVGDVFWVVGRERGHLTSDAATLELAIRTTRLFRRIDGRWRQVHHHGSIDDPDMLRRYQTAVQGSPS